MSCVFCCGVSNCDCQNFLINSLLWQYPDFKKWKLNCEMIKIEYFDSNGRSTFVEKILYLRRFSEKLKIYFIRESNLQIA